MTFMTDRVILTDLLGYSEEQTNQIIDKMREENILALYQILDSEATLGHKDLNG